MKVYLGQVPSVSPGLHSPDSLAARSWHVTQRGQKDESRSLLKRAEILPHFSPPLPLPAKWNTAVTAKSPLPTNCNIDAMVGI